MRHLLKKQVIRRALIPVDKLFSEKSFGQVGILMYHRITPAVRGQPVPTFNVTPLRFRQQLEGLLSSGYSPWPLRRLVEHHQQGLTVPDRKFVVTFDDGYECVYRHAWPILEELGIPATIFLATGYISGEAPFPFDDWKAAGSDRVPGESWRPLTIEQCREMAASGLVEPGAHSHTHRDFRKDPAGFREDMGNCIQFLHANFGIDRPTFAFPFGHTSPALADVVQQAGVICALTVEEEVVKPDSNPYDWGRFEACQPDTALTLSTCFNGWYDHARRGWRTLRAGSRHRK